MSFKKYINLNLKIFIDKKGASQVVLEIKNLPADAGDRRDGV